MRNKRRRWVWWTGGSLLLLVAIIAMSWNYAVNYVLESMVMQSLEADFNLDEIDFGTDWSTEDTDSVGVGSSGEGVSDPKGGLPQSNNDTPGGQAEPSDSKNGKEDKGDKDGNGSAVQTKPDPPASSVKPNPDDRDGQTSEPAGPTPGKQAEEPSYNPNITPDKAKQVQESITLKEKTKVTTVLLKRLGTGDISNLIKMAGNGVSVAEKKQAKSLLLEKLTEAEYNELIAIAKKYGLSQGKQASAK